MWKTTVVSLLLKQVIYPWHKGSVISAISVSAIIVVINTSADIKWDPFLVSLLGHWIFSSAAEMWKGYRCCKFSLHSELHRNWSLSEESTYKTMDLLPVLLHSQQVFFFLSSVFTWPTLAPGSILFSGICRCMASDDSLTLKISPSS